MNSFRQDVPTKHASRILKEDSIRDCVKQAPEGINAKEIAARTGIKYSTVRNLLWEGIEDVEKIRFTKLYHFVGDKGDRVFDWTFQNAVLSCFLPNYHGCHVSESFGDKDLAYYEFEIGVTHNKATLRLAAPRPLNISSIQSYFHNFQLLVEKYTCYKVREEDTWFSSLELQMDMIGVRMDGCTSITIKELLSIFKIYDKEHGLRIEYKFFSTIKPEVLKAVLTDKISSFDLINEIAIIKDNQIKVAKQLKKFSAIFEKFTYKNDKYKDAYF